MTHGVEVCMELGAAAADGGGIRARRYHVVARDPPEQRVWRGWHRGTERGIAHDTSDLAGRVAERYTLKRAAHIILSVLSIRHRQAHSQENRRDETRLHRSAFDLVLNELREQEGPLRVANQHDATAVVVVLEVIAPRVAHVVVRDRSLASRARPREKIGAVDRTEHTGAQSHERDLTVHRRIHAAV